MDLSVDLSVELMVFPEGKGVDLRDDLALFSELRGGAEVEEGSGSWAINEGGLAMAYSRSVCAVRRGRGVEGEDTRSQNGGISFTSSAIDVERRQSSGQLQEAYNE